MSDLIDRQAALDCFHDWIDRHGDVHTPDEMAEYRAIEELPSVEPEKRTEERTETHACDLISRQDAIDALGKDVMGGLNYKRILNSLPSAQPEQRYTEEELRVFRHGISLSLLSKRSAQHWHYDDDTATEIEFLERLYEKVGADMRGDEDE